MIFSMNDLDFKRITKTCFTKQPYLCVHVYIPVCI
ncbi:rCG56981, partial [Rattus norvegicus]